VFIKWRIRSSGRHGNNCRKGRIEFRTIPLWRTPRSSSTYGITSTKVRNTFFSLAGELRHTHDSDNAGAYRRENNDDIYALHIEYDGKRGKKPAWFLMRYNDEKYNYKTSMLFAFMANTHFLCISQKKPFS